jgi:transcriptional regulator with XRE-family HTH domain
LHHSIIGRYERDESKPTIVIVRNMAKVLDTTVGYLLEETQDTELFNDPTILERFKQLSTYHKTTMIVFYIHLTAFYKMLELNRRLLNKKATFSRGVLNFILSLVNLVIEPFLILFYFSEKCIDYHPCINPLKEGLLMRHINKLEKPFH